MEDSQDQVKSLSDGTFEVLVMKSFGQDEQITVRTTVTDASAFEAVRKNLYDNFIKPRDAEYKTEVVEYQKRMARESAAVENELNNKKGR